MKRYFAPVERLFDHAATQGLLVVSNQQTPWIDDAEWALIQGALAILKDEPLEDCYRGYVTLNKLPMTRLYYKQTNKRLPKAECSFWSDDPRIRDKLDPYLHALPLRDELSNGGILSIFSEVDSESATLPSFYSLNSATSFYWAHRCLLPADKPGFKARVEWLSAMRRHGLLDFTNGDGSCATAT